MEVNYDSSLIFNVSFENPEKFAYFDYHLTNSQKNIYSLILKDLNQVFYSEYKSFCLSLILFIANIKSYLYHQSIVRYNGFYKSKSDFDEQFFKLLNDGEFNFSERQTPYGDYFCLNFLEMDSNSKNKFKNIMESRVFFYELYYKIIRYFSDIGFSDVHITNLIQNFSTNFIPVSSQPM